MEQKDYLGDIAAIKEMMSKSSQFISLSGLSGVLAGIYALIGAFAANRVLAEYLNTNVEEYRSNFEILSNPAINQLLMIAIIVLALSIATGFILSSAKAKKANEKLWNSAAKRLLGNFMIPLASGGIFAVILLARGYFDLIAQSMLIFYGLSCINASRNTFRDVRYLGITMIFIGLTATAFPEYSLELWALGFGFCHIFYGLVMYFKYDRKAS